MTVALVLVSHLTEIAEGARRLALQMAPQVTVLAAGGTDEGEIGTSFDKVLAALTETQGADGTVVLFDLGSALLTAETAAEILGDDGIRIVDAPLVEGAVAAAAAAQQGADLSAVAAAAREQLSAGGERSAAEPGERAVTADVTLPNPLGLHARPAAELARRVTDPDAVVLLSGDDGAWVDARSVVAVIALGLRGGDVVRLAVEGTGAGEVLQDVVELLESGFGELESAAAPEGQTLSGVAASSGEAEGPAELLVVPTIETAVDARVPTGDEEVRLMSAIDGAGADLDAVDGPFQAIARAHRALLADPMLQGRAGTLLAEGVTAEQAWGTAVREAHALLSGVADAAMADRAADVLDVGARVAAALAGQPFDAGVPEEGTPGAVLVGQELLPSQVVRAHALGVVAVVAARGGETAHAAQLARALELPAVLGVGEDIREITAGRPVRVDGTGGLVTLLAHEAAPDSR